MKISVVSGGFDPLHSGHIEYFAAAKKISDYLVVLLNSDQWLSDKKGRPFMKFSERKTIVENLKMVDLVIAFKDDQDGSCSNGLQKVKKLFPNDEIYFCNGGDRNKNNIPEEKINDIKFLFNIGGSNKKNSSSWLIKDYFNNFNERSWGKYYDLYKDDCVRLKELIIYPSEKLSYQRHIHRNEIWFVSRGNCEIKISDERDPYLVKNKILEVNSLIHISKGMWHQIINTSKENCHIIEIQYGTKTVENDIERISVSP